MRYPNPGHPPRWPSDTLVHIRFRNGQERGPTPVSHWRWKPWPWGDHPFDIAEVWRA